MKKQTKKTVQFLILALSSSMIIFAKPAPDGATIADKKSQAFVQWDKHWKDVSNDWTLVSLVPGKSEKQMNFSWYCKNNATPSFLLGKNKNLSDAVSYRVKITETSQTDELGIIYNSCKVTVDGLVENQTYYYKAGDNTIESFKTGESKSTTFIFVGDPQIGSSNPEKAKKPEDITKPKFKSAQYDAVENDSFNWADTLNKAIEKTNGQFSFIVSAGDQIQTNATKVKNPVISEIEYTGYLSPSPLRNYPAAPTIGNHDADNKNFNYHFNIPNESALGNNGQAGGDYYFTYNNILFLMLNTQSKNVLEHKQFIEQAVKANPASKWRIVTLHQDIYGSAEHSNEPEIVNLRYSLVPVLQENNIDVVLTGHDHAYSRSKILYNDNCQMTQYSDDEFDKMFEKDINMDKPSNVYISPSNIKDDTNDNEEAEYINYIYSVMDKDCALSNVKQTTVKKPKGILYMTANSASGSKYYDLVPRKQSYIAQRWQEDVPTYSVITVTDKKFSIATYRTDTQKLIDSVFTIKK